MTQLSSALSGRASWRASVPVALGLPGAPGTLSTGSPTTVTMTLLFASAISADSYQYSINAGASWIALAGNKIVTGLSPATLYNFLVRAINIEGAGPVSNSAAGTTA